MYVGGTIQLKIYFNDLYTEGDSQSEILDALFPDGWEGELDVTHLEIDDIDEDDD